MYFPLQIYTVYSIMAGIQQTLEFCVPLPDGAYCASDLADHKWTLRSKNKLVIVFRTVTNGSELSKIGYKLVSWVKLPHNQIFYSTVKQFSFKKVLSMIPEGKGDLIISLESEENLERNFHQHHFQGSLTNDKWQLNRKIK